MTSIEKSRYLTDYEVPPIVQEAVDKSSIPPSLRQEREEPHFGFEARQLKYGHLPRVLQGLC